MANLNLGKVNILREKSNVKMQMTHQSVMFAGYTSFKCPVKITETIVDLFNYILLLCIIVSTYEIRMLDNGLLKQCTWYETSIVCELLCKFSYLNDSKIQNIHYTQSYYYMDLVGKTIWNNSWPVSSVYLLTLSPLQF